MRETDAGVARSSLDHRAARVQNTALFRVEHDPFCRTILHRTARIHEFGLAEDLAAGFVAQRAQPDQGGVADRTGKTITQIHRISSSFCGPLCVAAVCARGRPLSSRLIVTVSSSPVHLATTSVATPLPITLVSALASDMKRSMPSISVRPATGNVPTLDKVAANTMKPLPVTPAAPFDVSISTASKVSCWKKDIGVLVAWAMNRVAIVK